MKPPFFSIGVTTYNRVKMLKDTLSSISGQTFTDFEAIISNDNPRRTITEKLLEIRDPRIRFINQTKNLGERNNMNFLLKVSRGKYFTWFADDDLYHPEFLQKVYKTILKFNYPPCLFTSYTSDSFFSDKKKCLLEKYHLFTGREFLREYLTRSIKLQGCYGIFDRQYIKRIGGINKLGRGFSACTNDRPTSCFFPYADILLAVKSGLLEKVIFIDAPLILYRMHKGSVSLISTDTEAYRSAQDDLCSRSIRIFKSQELHDDFYSNLYLLLRWCIKDFTAVIRRAGFISSKQTIAYLKFLKKNLALLKLAQKLNILGFITKTAVKLMFNLSKDKLKTLTK